MTVRADISGVAGFDLTFKFSIKYAGAPLDLTGYTVSVTVKPSQTAADSTGTAYAAGSGLEWLSRRTGRFTLTIPKSATGTPGVQWYRVDVVNGSGSASPAMCGALSLIAA